MPRKVSINENFFNFWSPEMAWVLGVIFTDGHFGKANSKGIKRLYIAQKEPELLEKIRRLMNSKHKIMINNQTNKKSKIHYFSFTNKKIYLSLIKLGLIPKKSLKLKFPDMPEEYLRHFLRGCWDGDGSFYYEYGKPRKIRADYVSGSYDFIVEFVAHLERLCGIDKINIYKKHKNNTCFYIKLGAPNAIKLFPVFYKDVPEGAFLKAKYVNLRQSYELMRGQV